MKRTTFYLLLNLRTANGYESFGKFIIGNNRTMAYSLFAQLKGNKEVDEKAVLTMELMETINELPLNLQIISCTLEQLQLNCGTITKEIYKEMNLEP